MRIQVALTNKVATWIARQALGTVIDEIRPPSAGSLAGRTLQLARLTHQRILENPSTPASPAPPAAKPRPAPHCARIPPASQSTAHSNTPFSHPADRTCPPAPC